MASLRLFCFPLSIFVTFCCADLTAADDSDASAAITAEQQEFFEKEVRPVLVQRCYECHAGDEVNGGLLLDSKAGVLNGGDSGASVVAGKPDQSLLIEAVRYKNRDLQMPPQNRMPDAEIAVLEKWVAMGAPDPRTDAVSSGAKPTGMSIEEGREFWSFRPVASPEVPEVNHAEWVRNPIDAFILSKLEAAGLQPAPRADKRTLIRRVTFNLTGLPPTPEEVDAFLADESEDAFTKVVERLLSSPQYGVRWGRHWLDVARYADSNGLDENLAHGNAWRYRDYVVNAFNSDKPYDQFVVEQLAGDLVPNATAETKTATGFLVLGAKVLAEPDMEKLVMDTIDEQLDTFGKAFMGMTVGCVRCHDHKFDPLKQKDYYALAAIFKSTRTFVEEGRGAIKYWHEYSFATEEELAKLKVVDAEIAKLKSAAASFKNKAIAKVRDDARSKATEYLMAATTFDPSMALSQVTAIAKPLGLHPRILHHCRLHLDYNRDDPFFAPWHLLASSGGAEAVEQHYRARFAAASGATSGGDIPAIEIEEAKRALNDLSGFLAVPPKVEYAFDDATLQEYYKLEEAARVKESNAPDEPAAMGVSEQETLAELPIHIRGSHLNLGEPVAREFPIVMRASTVRPVFPKSQSGRLQLANWLVNTQHPLTARVFVNRVWGWHTGRGIVGTTENFGRLGDRPSHPELLDWLARSLMENGWSTKDLHRLILTSNTYQMASTHPDGDQAAEQDPENLLLWKFRMQRLEAEQIRDAVLAVSNRLDMSIGGKSVPLRNRQFVFNHTSVDHTKYDSLRRGMYLPIIRNNLYTMFEQFDFPDPTMVTGHRNETVVAPQALLMMNSDLIMDSANALAATVTSQASGNADRVRIAYEGTLNRPPRDEEIARALAYVDEFTAQRVSATGIDEMAEIKAWSLLCQSLFASNEFIYVR